MDSTLKIRSKQKARLGIIANLSDQIKRKTKTNDMEPMTKPFTITGRVEQTVFLSLYANGRNCGIISLTISNGRNYFKIMKNYFKYILAVYRISRDMEQLKSSVQSLTILTS